MSMRMKFSLSCLMALCVALGVAQAQPQPQPQPQQSSAPPNALQGFSQNRNQPVQINAQTLEVRDKSKVATYTGNVKLVQGDTTLHCKILIVYYDGGNQAAGQTVQASTPGPSGSQQIRKIEAIGNVIVTQKDQTATGEKAIYDTVDDTVRLFAAPGGYVAVTQGPNIVRGPRLTVHLDTGVSHFEGGDVYSLIVPNAMKTDNHTAPAATAAHPAPSAHQAAPHATPKSRSTSPSDLY
jgi:lipopolysaccharide export system protein LptA